MKRLGLEALLLGVESRLHRLFELIEELGNRGLLVGRHIPKLLKELLYGAFFAQQITAEQLDIFGALDLAELTLEALGQLNDVCL